MGCSLRPRTGPGTPHTRIPQAHHSWQWEFTHSFYRQLREPETPAQSCPAAVTQPHGRPDRPHPRVRPSPPGCVLWANAVQHKQRDPRARHRPLLWTPCLAVKMQEKLCFSFPNGLRLTKRTFYNSLTDRTL